MSGTSVRALASASSRFVLAAACAALCACMDDADGENESPTCDMRYTGRQLEGDWTLSGSGQRHSCSSRRLDGDLRLRTEMPIAVASAPQPTSGGSSGPAPANEADAFVARIERADYLISLDDDAADEVTGRVTLQGGTNGSCVSFDLTEELPGGDEVVYHFDGFIVGSSTVRGEFWGDGPGECEVEGEFELSVR